MPDARGQPLPSEILAALKSPAITSWLRSFLIATTSAESIGRFPGNGSAQVDSYVYPDAADATFPYSFDYVIPSNFQRFISGKLSFKIRPYRTYNTFSATVTGSESAFHTHAIANVGSETAFHYHTTKIANAAGAGSVFVPSANTLGANTGSDQFVPTSNESASHAHVVPNTGNELATHIHTIPIASTLGIFEGSAPVNPGITVAVDGVDVTAKIGGPFNSDQVEIDMSQLIATTPKIWHTVSLQPNQRVRLTGILRLAYYTDSRLTQ